MSQRTSMRPPKGGNIKKGICQNHKYTNPDTGETGDCPKCASGEIQSVNVQRLSDFRCSVCGSKLMPIKEKSFTKMILISLGIIAVIAIFLIVKSCNGGEEGQGPGPDSVPPDTIVVPPLPPVDTAGTDTVNNPPKQEGPQTPPPPQPQHVLGGAAKLVKGTDGYIDIVFLRDYTLDLGKNDGQTIQITKGEVIERANIRNNVLRGGTYINRNKEENELSALNVRL